MTEENTKDVTEEVVETENLEAELHTKEVVATEESSDVTVTETQEVQNISIEPIITEDQSGKRYQYFKVLNGEFEHIIFTIQEISFIENDEGEKTAHGRVLFEETKEFTSSQLLQSEDFGNIIRDVFDKIVEEIVIAAKAQQAEVAATEAGEIEVSGSDQVTSSENITVETETETGE